MSDFLRDENGELVPFDECPREEQIKRRFWIYGVLGRSFREAAEKEDHD